jgi:NAD-dependent dihydropyrimidine dehydrogenase PreA subunit
MIEVVDAESCTACDRCVRVCPMDVFDTGIDGVPVIARQSDCQTCFMCEAYCPSDALYVAPLYGPAPEASAYRDLAALRSAGAIGQYRETLGWGPGRTPGARRDKNHLITIGRITPEPARLERSSA